jgi:hypothetical protein
MIPRTREVNIVKDFRFRLALVGALFLSLLAGCVALAQEAPTEEAPADFSGKWTLYCKDPDGTTSTKYLEIKQDGETLSGHFKGPYTSGGIEGTIHGKHMLVRTKTRHVLAFRGRIDGDKITGTFHAPKGEGTFEAVRTQ